MEVKAILVDQSELSEAVRQLRSGDGNLAFQLVLQGTYRAVEVIRDERGVGADRLQRTRHDPFAQIAPRGREVAFRGPPPGLVFVPVAHDLVHAAAVDAAGQLAHVLNPMTEERGTGGEPLVVDVTVERYVHSED